MDFSNLFITGFILNNLYPILTTLIVILYRSISIYNFDSTSDPINSEDLIEKIQEDGSFVTAYTFKQGVKKCEGLFFNLQKRYIGYIKNYQASTHYSTNINYQIFFYGRLPIKIKSLNENDVKIKDNKLIKLYLSDCHFNGDFKEIKIPFNFPPYPNQQTIIDKIDDIYQNHKFNICRALIWGNPGGGKSFIGKILTQKYDSALCFDINLLDPGTPILKLWQKVMPSKEKPLIIQIDEIDVIITKIHNKVTKSNHDWLKIMVSDKQSFNTFLSEYVPCLPYVIYLFTMNCAPQEINKFDSSYIRENRIDLIETLNHEKKDK